MWNMMLPAAQEGAPLLITISFVAASLLYSLWNVLRQYLETKKPFRELPMAPGSHFLLGHINTFAGDDFKKSSQHLWVNYANECGQTGVWMFRFPIIGVNSVKDARTVLAAEHERHPPRLVKHFNRNFIGSRNLLTLNGKEWKYHRSAVARTFNPKFLHTARLGMAEVAETMVASLQEKIHQSPDGIEEFDVERLMKMVTMDIFGRTALSTDLELCKTLKPSPLVRAFEYILNGTMSRLRSPFFPLENFFFSLPTEKNRIHKRERTLIRSFVADLINHKRDSIQDQDKDLLSHLIRAHRDIPGGKLKEDDVSDEAMTDVLMTLLFAGYDTTSVILTFALYQVATNPEVQERCWEEVRTLKSIQNVEDLVYCKAVIWEVLRLYPAGIYTNRNLAKPLPLSGGFVAPAGTRVIVPIYNIQRDEKNFPHPEEFRPERWAKQNEEGYGPWVERDVGDESSSVPTGDKNAFLAFSAGGRNCVGQKFATQEAVIVFAALVKGLKFSAVPGYIFDTTNKDLILKPKNGMPLKIEART